MGWISPYFEDGQWLRGSFHTHTVVSDGGHTLEETVQLYHASNTGRNERMDYRFLAITDHNTNAKLNLFEHPQSTGEMILIEGREESYSRHIVGVGCRMNFQEDPVGRGKADFTLEEHQKVVDAILRDGGMAILAHPHWADEEHWSKENAVGLQGYTAIEIINGDVFSGPGHLATDVWDAALTAGKKVWATGNDDFHSVRDFHNAWNMVYVQEATAEGILRALRHGSLYVSNGACFDKIYADGDWIVAEGHPDSIYARTEKTFRFIGAGGEVLQRQIGKGRVAAYKAQGNEQYVRVEMALDWGMAAFSMPFFPDGK